MGDLIRTSILEEATRNILMSMMLSLLNWEGPKSVLRAWKIGSSIAL